MNVVGKTIAKIEYKGYEGVDDLDLIIHFTDGSKVMCEAESPEQYTGNSRGEFRDCLTLRELK